MTDFKIDGVVPIIPTPFNSREAIDWPSFESLLSFAISARVRAVCLPAYASEFYKLSGDEPANLVCRALHFLKGRLPVIAQVNQYSTMHAARIVREMEQAGASAISVAVPRLFSLPERSLLRYFDRILAAVSVPLIIQDFNPGGATVSVDFVKSLHSQHRHFRYLKLEEPLMASRVREISEATFGEVGVIDGWGGMYIIELMDAGIHGVMPGLAVSDILQVVWNKAQAGEKDAAYELFQGVLPQIVYSLQNMEFFHHAEKSLLVARGVLSRAAVREVTVEVSEVDRTHMEFLNRKIVQLVRRRGVGVPSRLAEEEQV